MTDLRAQQFRGALPEALGKGACVGGRATGRKRSLSEPSSVSDFPQEIVDLPFRRLNPESDMPYATRLMLA